MVPPPDLIDEWRRAPEYTDGLGKLTMVTITIDRLQYIAHQAARWGADMELEACEKYWMTHGISPQGVVAMRYARRPMPPSLKELALTALSEADQGLNESEWQQRSDTIRRALEQLDD
jgi:hypothetical protein